MGISKKVVSVDSRGVVSPEKRRAQKHARMRPVRRLLVSAYTKKVVSPEKRKVQKHVRMNSVRMQLVKIYGSNVVQQAENLYQKLKKLQIYREDWREAVSIFREGLKNKDPIAIFKIGEIIAYLTPKDGAEKDKIARAIQELYNRVQEQIIPLIRDKKENEIIKIDNLMLFKGLAAVVGLAGDMKTPTVLFSEYTSSSGNMTTRIVGDKCELLRVEPTEHTALSSNMTVTKRKTITIALHSSHQQEIKIVSLSERIRLSED